MAFREASLSFWYALARAAAIGFAGGAVLASAIVANPVTTSPSRWRNALAGLVANRISRTAAIGVAAVAVLANGSIANPVTAGGSADPILTRVTARTRAIGGTVGAVLGRRIASPVTARARADPILTRVTPRTRAIGGAVGAVLGRRIASPVTAGGSADAVLTGVTACTSAIRGAVGAVLGRRIASSITARVWTGGADAIDAGLIGCAGVAARAAVRLVGRFVDAHAAADRLAFLAARRAGAASSVVVDVRDVSAAGGDGCLGAIGGRQRAPILGIHALPATTRATEDTQAAGEKRWGGGLKPGAAQANAAGR